VIAQIGNIIALIATDLNGKLQINMIRMLKITGKHDYFLIIASRYDNFLIIICENGYWEIKQEWCVFQNTALL
jgi:hypothetical protein